MSLNNTVHNSIVDWIDLLSLLIFLVLGMKFKHPFSLGMKVKPVLSNLPKML